MPQGYFKRRKRNPIDIFNKYISKIKNRASCWIWEGTLTSAGYGQFTCNGIVYYAHRFSAQLNIPNPNLLPVVRHKCDNPSCVNPAHLEYGTQKDNVRDMYLRNRNNNTNAPRGEKNCNSILTKEQVIQIRKQYIPGINQYNKSNSSILMSKFNISPGCFYPIINRKTWKHI